MASQRAKPLTLCVRRDRGAMQRAMVLGVSLTVVAGLQPSPSVAAPPAGPAAPTVESAPRLVASPLVRRPLAIIDIVGTPPSQALANKLSAALLSNGQLAPISDATLAAALVGPLEDVEDEPLATARRAHELPKTIEFGEISQTIFA